MDKTNKKKCGVKTEFLIRFLSVSSWTLLSSTQRFDLKDTFQLCFCLNLYTYKNESIRFITNHCFVCGEKASSGDHDPENETVLNLFISDCTLSH